MKDEGAPPRPNGGFRLYTTFIKSPSGIAFMVNILLYFISACAIGHVNDKYTHGYVGSVNFLLAVSVITFITYVLFFVLMLVGIIPQKLKMINWPLSTHFQFLIDSAVNGGFYFIASCVFAIHTSKYRFSPYDTASVFGFIAMIGSLVQASMHFLEIRKGATQSPPPVE